MFGYNLKGEMEEYARETSNVLNSESSNRNIEFKILQTCSLFIQKTIETQF